MMRRVSLKDPNVSHYSLHPRLQTRSILARFQTNCRCCCSLGCRARYVRVCVCMCVCVRICAVSQGQVTCYNTKCGSRMPTEYCQQVNLDTNTTRDIITPWLETHCFNIFSIVVVKSLLLSSAISKMKSPDLVTL